jgi:hypothetical protein
VKPTAFVIEAGLSEKYYAPHTEEFFTSIRWQAKIYTSRGNASRAIYAMRFNPKVKELKRQGIRLRVRPVSTEYLQLSLF